MLCLLVPLLLFVLTETSTSLSLSGTDSASPCPPRWLVFGQQCFAFYPVWSSWSTAKFKCSLTGGNLVSLRTQEEKQFVSQLANTHSPVWLGGCLIPQNVSSFWSNNSTFGISSSVNHRNETRVGGACLEMTPKSNGGELHHTDCEELRFYICSTPTSSVVLPSTPVESGIVPGVSLFDVVWSKSDSLAENIFHSFSFLKELQSCQLTERCYTNFIQQETLYLHRVSHTLEALISRLQEADDMKSLLLDTLKHYRSRNQSLLASPPPKWPISSLQSFHSVVLEEPVYWLVALSARASLRNFLAMLSSEPTPVPRPEADSVYLQWSRDSQKEAVWTQRYRKVIEEHQNQMDVFKAINIFKEQMTNQKNFYKAVDCDAEGDG